MLPESDNIYVDGNKVTYKDHPDPGFHNSLDFDSYHKIMDLNEHYTIHEKMRIIQLEECLQPGYQFPNWTEVEKIMEEYWKMARIAIKRCNRKTKALRQLSFRCSQNNQPRDKDGAIQRKREKLGDVGCTFVVTIWQREEGSPIEIKKSSLQHLHTPLTPQQLEQRISNQLSPQELDKMNILIQESFTLLPDPHYTKSAKDILTELKVLLTRYCPISRKKVQNEMDKHRKTLLDDIYNDSQNSRDKSTLTPIKQEFGSIGEELPPNFCIDPQETSSFNIYNTSNVNNSYNQEISTEHCSSTATQIHDGSLFVKQAYKKSYLVQDYMYDEEPLEIMGFECRESLAEEMGSTQYSEQECMADIDIPMIYDIPRSDHLVCSLYIYIYI